MDRAKVQRLYDQGLTLREIAARLDAEGCSTAQGRQWTENAVWHWLGKRGRRQELECAHEQALADAKRRSLTNREAAAEFNARGLPRVGRRGWTAEVVRQRRVQLNRRRRRLETSDRQPDASGSIA